MDGKCECNPGWEGADCNTKSCDPRCLLHGACFDGECHCSQGWGGKHCTLDHCPTACSGNGECVRDPLGGWRCECQAGWRSPSHPADQDCSLPQELVCGDGQDNDQGGSF